MTTALTILIGLIIFLFFAWIARRLLGVKRLSASRTFLSSLIGLAAGILVGFYVTRRGFELDVAVLTAVALGLLFTMVMVIVFESVLRPSHRVSQGRWTRRIGDRIDVVRRSGEVTRIFSRHGLSKGIGLFRGVELDPDEAQQLGVSLRLAFEEAGGVFVKLGQLLATRPDVVPPEIAAELEFLHSNVTPAPVAEIRPVLEESLGARVEDVFNDFDWAPIGSASIGQVYRAALGDGADVVVKVRRPGITENIKRDLIVLDDLARVAEAQVEQARQMGLASVVEEFAHQLRRELDYRVEARNVIEVGISFAADDIVVPDVYDEFSDDRVLVLGYVGGTSVGDLPGPPINGRSLADSLFDAEVQAMLHGHAFHADLHPGNVLVNQNGLALVDFGAVGRLDAYERAAVGDILTALEIHDPTMLREAALEVGMRSDASDVTGLDRSLSRLMADHLNSEHEPSFQILTDFMAISRSHGLRMPGAISAMLRALATLDGTVRLLAPDYNLVAAARKLARQEMLDSLSPETLTEDLKREVVRLAPILRRAPYQLDRISGQLSRGEMTVRVSLFSTAEDTKWLGEISNRALMAFLGAVIGIVSVMLFQTTGGPELTSNISLFQLLGYIGLFGGAVLVMRVILEILRES